MTATLDNITGVVAAPLDEGGWAVHFASANPGLYHQLYANAALAGWTEHPDYRQFLVGELPHACELAVAAVSVELRRCDLADRLGLGGAVGWIAELAVVRPFGPAGLQLVVRGDHATGTLDDQPLTVEDLCPSWSSPVGWGLDTFGLGLWGNGDSLGPGLGRGGFGAGPFGCDGELLVVRIPLMEDGEHRLELTAEDALGRASSPVTVTFHSSPPPPPAQSLVPLDYDDQAHILTLAIN